MMLEHGTKLGPYEVIASLGAGGMGEVYRARDPRLQRDVAVKILPASLVTDPIAHARFERETQAVAALSHPNILAIHDVGREGDRAYAVMELLEGRTLREALSGGALPVRKAIDLALQTAHGLAAAHARGIVHRDLKPENLFLCTDGRLKILDFGLAHDTPGASQKSPMTAATAADTTPGTIVGTVGYMAPEQIRGVEVDARADIFSFGAVLHEMLAGQRAFDGATRADLLSAVLRNDPPDLTTTRHDVPPALDQLVRRCLEKSREERFESARDLAYVLEAISTGTSARAGAESLPLARRTRRWPLVAAAALAAGIALGVLAARSTTAPRAAELTPVRFTIPSALGQPPWVSVSPDGDSVAWSQADPVDNSMVIWLRRLSDSEAHPLPWSGRGDANGMSEWSTDGRSLAVLSGGALSIFDIATGAQRILYTATDEDRATLARGLAVSSDAVFVGARNIIVKLALAGGSPVPFTTLDRSRHAWHGFPRVLPDGRVIFIARRSNAAAAETLVASRDGEIIGRLELPATALRVAIDPAGAVIYAQGSSLVAQAVDWSTLRLAGRPATIANDAIIDPGTGAISASVSAGGVLAYRVAALARVQFEWMDRSGRPLGVIGPADTFTNFDLSPNGNTIAVTRREQTQNWLWTIDVARAVAAPADTTQTAPPSDPTWSPDGQSLAIRRGNTLVVRPAFGGAERVITKWQAYPDSWSRDGKYLAVGRPMPGGNYELWAVRADGAAVEELPLVTGVSLADEARFSPDGRWLAFHAGTERADTTQVFVIPFPPTGERWQLSANGGMQPRWRADGRELLFLSPDGRMMSVAMPNGDPRRAAAPVPLFRTAFEVSASNDQFTIAADGRILVRRPVSGPGTDQAPVAVLVNWRKIVGLE